MSRLSVLFRIARDPRTVATVGGYALIAKLMVIHDAPVVSLCGLLLSLLAHLGHHALRHREKVHAIHGATAEHVQAQQALQGKVEELGNTVKALSNVVGGGSNWSSK